MGGSDPQIRNDRGDTGTMKKTFALLIILAVICTTSISMAADLTLPVKMERQMQHDGNGLKGNIRITANASPEQYPFLYAIQNADYSVLRNMSGEMWHLVLFQSDEQEQQINRLELYQGENQLFFRSDYLQDRVFSMPETNDILSAVLKREMSNNDNPPILDVLTTAISMKETERNRWTPVIEKYTKKLEVWLADFASEPELLRNPDGSVQMNLIYIVPADALRKEIVNLITEAASDSDVMELMKSVLTEEQKNTYMNAGLVSYYTDALNSISLNSDMKFVKTVSALGEMIASEIILPLDSETTGYHTLTIRNLDGTTGYTLNGDNGMILIEVPEAIPEILAQESFEAKARYIYISKAEDLKNSNQSVAITITKSYSGSVDSETEKEHEIHHYDIIIERDTGHLPEGVSEDDIPAFEPVHIDAVLHFSGKAGPNAPTTLETDIQFEKGELIFQINGKLKTAATWPFMPFNIEQAVSVNDMSEGEMTAVLLEWMTNATEKTIRITDKGDNEE